MDVLLDAALTQAARREPAASAVLARDPVPQANTAAGALTTAAVGASARGEKPKTAAGDDRRDDRAAERPAPAARPMAGGKVELQFNYEQELNRIFLDLVGRESGDDRLMRMPPEQFARYIEQIKDGAAAAADASPRVDAVV